MTREWPDGWGIESTRFHGPNVVSCEIVTGPTQTPLVGAYFPPSTLEHLPYIKEALQRLKGWVPIILGDIKVDLDDAWSSRVQRVADLLMEYCLIDRVRCSRQRCWFLDLKTWTQFRQSTVLCLRCYCILGMDRRRFGLVGIRDVLNYTSDHFAIRDRLF